MSAVNVKSSSQQIIVNAPNDEINVILGGPQGPAGTPGVGVGGTGLPAGGTVNQVLVKNSSTNGDASWKNLAGFTYVTDVMPTPVRAGETWFDSSDSASGGSSWVAIDENPAGGGEKVWVQFSTVGTSKLMASAVLEFNRLLPVAMTRIPFTSSTSNDASSVTLDNAGIITLKRAGNYFISVHYAVTMSPSVGQGYYHTQLYTGGTVIAESVEHTGQPYGTCDISAPLYNAAANTLISVFAATAGGAGVYIRSFANMCIQEI